MNHILDILYKEAISPVNREFGATYNALRDHVKEQEPLLLQNLPEMKRLDLEDYLSKRAMADDIQCNEYFKVGVRFGCRLFLSLTGKEFL